VTIAAAALLEAWPEVFSSPVITELAPGRVWGVTTERGDRYVLKKVSTFNAPDPARRFTDEARIVTHLLQRGVPVAVPVLSNDGRPYTTDDDGALHAVFPMLPQGASDDGPGLDPVLYQNVGAAIARMHTALADCPFGIESWEVGPGLLAALWQTAEERLPAAALIALSARVRPRWDSIIQALSAVPQRIHGDVHGGNLLTVGQEVTGIIDIDHLPLAPRGYDLGYYIAFAGRWWLDGNEPSRPVDEIRHLLTGYDTVSPLTQQENDDLPALALAAALGLIDHFAREHDLLEESWLRTAHWIGDNFDALRLPAPAFDVSAPLSRPVPFEICVPDVELDAVGDEASGADLQRRAVGQRVERAGDEHDRAC
jgi:Ser/Thr protein kinase RdoA (MazF antagonist)